MVHAIVLLLKGAAIGIANIIPGVSGGTTALILGIYERLINAIHKLGPRTFRELLPALTVKPQGIARAKAELRRIDAGFLIMLGIGAVIAVVLTASLMEYLLQNLHDPTYGFFCGVILISIAFPWQMRKGTLSGGAIAALVVGTILSLLLSMSMVGPQQAEKAQEKLRMKQERVAVEQPAGAAALDAAPVPVGELDHSPGRLLYVGIAGAIAISAMILPGVSGSFIALMMGVYFDLLGAIADVLGAVRAPSALLAGDLPWPALFVVAAFGIGCVVGILAFSRLLNYVLRRWHDPTMLFLIGLMIGSLYGLWPFRDFQLVGDEVIYTSLRLPQVGANLWITLGAFLAGIAIIVPFLRFESQLTDAEHDALKGDHP